MDKPILSPMKQLAYVTAFSVFCMLLWLASPPIALVVYVVGGIMLFSGPG